MKSQTLSVTTRTVTGRKVKSLRRQGIIPASVFGRHIPSVNLQVKSKDFFSLYKKVGDSTLFYLDISGEKDKRPVMVSEVVFHPVSSQLLHITFHQVDLKEKVVASVKIILTGEAPAEKDKLGILVQQLNELEVEALPADMPDHIDVDISSLAAVNQAVYAKDLKLSSKLEIKSELESIIAKIEPLAKEEVKEVAPAEAAPVEGVAPGIVEETIPTEKSPVESKPKAE
ncbi:hypothetical protein A3D85_00335 [Candidatus Amesbacteria bacterium RIFCSPHIGHO2_02_FULL_47_9]|uniref:Large ribosomal subunit protein bL25 n=1 Tax=Candidatus Amesbacteria bacterium RIFCSPHIGHO2_01_FULL_48_32b TaxID=1797253 RepID=A0A1F4YH90_9BACT|nr:MAG: hypothetical protein A2876_01040 [Candidatus Amesbacteria bacterium RIFCSPHIGHO2_01_FULL_48_32b]OGD03526.1 MAG: hypothetical protein A3D85_00335 [Candidatus Amesbacteria bacterium RIFCSPHIGHO2_02_FULL_47_9]OGD07398.1 MAG: hypothetical protein A2899_03790 [Candidatus Amesbacteria bacterium RIFCSPLOWO2_01_FULL_49_25]